MELIVGVIAALAAVVAVKLLTGNRSSYGPADAGLNPIQPRDFPAADPTLTPGRDTSRP